MASAPALARATATRLAPKPPRPFPPERRVSRALIAAAMLPLLLVMIAPTAYDHVRAVSILFGIADIAPGSGIRQFDSNPVEVQEITFPSYETVRARIYHPIGIAHPSALVVVPGVHHLGMDEPRLRRFAQSLSSHGYVVMTPQIDDLANYNISARSAVVIRDAVHELRSGTGAQKVGLLGLSFAGGMSLIAATDGRTAHELSTVIAIGSHDDLNRVLEFYATNQTVTPQGTTENMTAHEYGSFVTAYTHAEVFFAPEDVAQAKVAIRYLLWEDENRAKLEAGKLGPAGQLRMQQMFAHNTQSLVPDTKRSLELYQDEIRATSPHYQIQNLRVPVLLLHGAADNVVPPAETLWLEHDLPPGTVREALISRAIGHVEVDNATLLDQWKLVHWMVQMLHSVDVASAEHP